MRKNTTFFPTQTGAANKVQKKALTGVSLLLRLLVVILSMSVTAISPAATAVDLPWEIQSYVRNHKEISHETTDTFEQEVKKYYEALTSPNKERFLAVLKGMGHYTFNPTLKRYTNLIKPHTMLLVVAESAIQQAHDLADRENTICSYFCSFASPGSLILGTILNTLSATTPEERGRRVEEIFAGYLEKHNTTEEALRELTDRIDHITRLAHDANLTESLKTALSEIPADGPPEARRAAYETFVSDQGGEDELQEECQEVSRAAQQTIEMASKIRALGLASVFSQEHSKIFPTSTPRAVETLQFYKDFFARHEVEEKFAVLTRIETLYQLFRDHQIIDSFTAELTEDFASQEAELATLEDFGARFFTKEQLNDAIAMHIYGHVGEEDEPAAVTTCAPNHIQTLAQAWKTIEQAAQHLQDECPCIYACITKADNHEEVNTKLAANAYKKMVGQTTKTKKARDALYDRLKHWIDEYSLDCITPLTTPIKELEASVSQLERIQAIIDAANAAFPENADTPPPFWSEFTRESTKQNISPDCNFNDAPAALNILEQLSTKYQLKIDSFPRLPAKSSGGIAQSLFVSGCIAGTTLLAFPAAYAYFYYKNLKPTDETGKPISFKQYLIQEFKKKGAFFYLTLASGALVAGGASWSTYNYFTATRSNTTCAG